jgi:hypothetical protein
MGSSFPRARAEVIGRHKTLGRTALKSHKFLTPTDAAEHASGTPRKRSMLTVLSETEGH